MTRLVVGLGNPGPEYEGTRHNVGYEVVERIAGAKGSLFRSARRLEGWTGRGLFTFARVDDPPALLVRPTTYMNLSGEAIAPLARLLGGEAGLDPARLLVVFDDMDLPLGSLRLRPQGGAGGQKGMRSIIDRLGTDRFPRLRVGIGRPRTDAARHVLSAFSDEERAEVDAAVAEAAEAILDWLGHGDIEKCMTRFHSRWNQDS